MTDTAGVRVRPSETHCESSTGEQILKRSLFKIVCLFRNWTSIELAKPVWEDEPKLRQGLDDLSLSEYSGGRRGQAEGQGSVEPVDMDLVDTYGYWDQSLDIMPALSRSVAPRLGT